MRILSRVPSSLIVRGAPTARQRGLAQGSADAELTSHGIPVRLGEGEASVPSVAVAWTGRDWVAHAQLSVLRCPGFAGGIDGTTLELLAVNAMERLAVVEEVALGASRK